MGAQDRDRASVCVCVSLSRLDMKMSLQEAHIFMALRENCIKSAAIFGYNEMWPALNALQKQKIKEEYGNCIMRLKVR